MKKIIIFSLFLGITSTTFSQQNNPSPILTKQEYEKLSKNLKTAAWVALGGGFVLTTIGGGAVLNKASKGFRHTINTIIGNPQPAPQNNHTGQTIMLLTGLTSMLVSIPLFKASVESKRKAMSISFKNEPSLQIQNSSFVYRAIPSLTLKFQL